MRTLAKFLAPQLAESFRLDQVTLWYTTHSLRNFESSNYKIHKMFNCSRYAAYKKYALVHKADAKAVITWDEHPGRRLAREEVDTWRVSTVDGQVKTYRYHAKFHNTRYQTPFPTTGVDSLLMFFVYRLDAFANKNDEENYLVTTSSVAYETERGICFTPPKFAVSGKRSLRVHGVANDIGHQEFSDWGSISDPTKLGVWNVIGVHWDVRPGKTSSVWFNYGKDYGGGKMFTFKAATAKKGAYVMIGNTSDRFTGGQLDGALSNIEVYESQFIDDHVIAAQMRYLSDYYGISDSIYT